jgi:tetratricopeptide (TPR) repeat protein
MSRAADPAPSEALRAARQSLAELNWKQVINRYEPLQATAQKDTPEWREATFCLATGYQHVQPPDQDTIGRAESLYQEIVRDSKDVRYVTRSMMNLGRIAELRDYPGDKMDLDGARAKYLEVVEKYPNEPIASEATLRAGATLVMAYDAPSFEKAKQGIALLEKWLADHPKDPMASVMWEYTGNSYFQPLNDPKNAMRCWENCDRIGWIDPANQGPAFWRAAQVAERQLKEPKIAAKYYRKIILDTPTSGKAYQAALALQAMGEQVPVSPLLGDLLKPRQNSSEATTQPAGGSAR